MWITAGGQDTLEGMAISMGQKRTFISLVFTVISNLYKRERHA
jgi:hypothetical protein